MYFTHTYRNHPSTFNHNVLLETMHKTWKKYYFITFVFILNKVPLNLSKWAFSEYAHDYLAFLLSQNVFSRNTSWKFIWLIKCYYPIFNFWCNTLFSGSVKILFSALNNLDRLSRYLGKCRFLILLFKLLTLSLFSLSLSPLCSLSQSSLYSLSTIPSFSSLSSKIKDFKFHYILFHQRHIFFFLFHTMTFFLIMHSISL